MKNQIKAGIVLQYINVTLAIVITLFYTPVMLKTLGQSEYGIYNLANSLIAYLSLLSLGFGSSYLRFYSRYKKNNDQNGIKRLNGLFMIVFSIISVISLGSGLLLSNSVKLLFGKGFTSSELGIAKILMLVLTVNMSLSFPASVFISYITSQEKFVFQKVLNIIKTIISPFVTIPLLLLGYGSIGMVLATTVVTIIIYGINIFYCLKKLHMKFAFKNIDFSLFFEIAKFSVFIAMNMIIDQINWSTDKIIIGRIVGTEAVAVYGVSSIINQMYITFSVSIASVFSPRINTLVANDEKNSSKIISKLFTQVGRIQFVVLALILSGFVFFGKFFILKWAGAEYNEAYIIILLLIVPITIPLIQNLGIEIQRAKNKHQFRSYVYLAMAVLNIFISIYLCRLYGAIGAALGTTISLIIANIFIMNIYYHKVLEIDMLYFWKEIGKFLPALIIPILTGVLISKYIQFDNMIIYLLSVIVYSVVYTLSMWVFGLNRTEKNLIIKPLTKILSNLVIKPLTKILSKIKRRK